jgi:2-polyprenyl-3-methyl-5-hydroxy-6-metoxy-1,4-benzoquinol methylase
MSDQVREFYNMLAANYHFIFADWHKSIVRQSEVLDRLLRSYVDSGANTVLDCACGIGTQAIGLAMRGWEVHATDLSTEAVERAQVESEALGLKITFGVADFRALRQSVPGIYDAVIACDNAIAHLQTPLDLAQALDNMASKLTPGGALLLSLRDYDRTVQEMPRSTMPVIHDIAGERTIVFQVWDWHADESGYRLSHFTVKQNGNSYETISAVSDLRAWQRAEITAALERIGLSDIAWHMPDSSGFYQPIVTARNPD